MKTIVILILIIVAFVIGLISSLFFIQKEIPKDTINSDIEDNKVTGIDSQVKDVMEKQIDIEFTTSKPGFGYGTIFIINNSGKYIGVSANDYWMNRLGNPQTRFFGEINYQELLSIYNIIEEKGFFNWNGDYSSISKDYAGGTSTSVSVTSSENSKKVSVFGNFGPEAYYEVTQIISGQFPAKKDCSLKNQKDFPDINLTQHSCPDPYYDSYYNSCTCI